MRERKRRDAKGGLGGDQLTNHLTPSVRNTLRGGTGYAARGLLDWTRHRTINILYRYLWSSCPTSSNHQWTCTTFRFEQRHNRWAVSSDHNPVHILTIDRVLHLGQKMGGEESARLFAERLA